MSTYPEDASHYNLYQRPTDGLVNGLASRMLGPLPDRMPVIEAFQAEQITKSLPPIRQLPALLTAIAAVGGALIVETLLPLLLVNPMLAAYRALTGNDEPTAAVSQASAVIETIAAGAVLVLSLVIIVLLLGRSAIFEINHNPTAVKREQQFHGGAENWTVWQRIASCIAYGSCTSAFMVSPGPVLVALGAVGTAGMMVYLREYRRSHNTVRATLTSAKFTDSCFIYGAAAVALVASFRIGSFFVL